MKNDPTFLTLATSGPIGAPEHVVRLLAGDFKGARRALEERRQDRLLENLRQAAGRTTSGRTS